MAYGIDDYRLGKLLLDMEELAIRVSELETELAEEIKECNEQAMLVAKFAARWEKEREMADRLAQILRGYVEDPGVQHTRKSHEVLLSYRVLREGA